MSQPSNESQLLRGAFVPTLIVSIVAIAASAVVQGKSGFWGALLAQFVVIIFFVNHIAVSRMTRNLDPISTMAMALFSYFAKLFALGICCGPSPNTQIGPPLTESPLESPR
jgi:fructose-specific phosphotransferase system IIC component